MDHFFYIITNVLFSILRKINTMVFNNNCSALQLMGQISSDFIFSQVSSYLCSELFSVMITFSVCSHQSVTVLHGSLMVPSTKMIRNTAFLLKSLSHIYRLYCFCFC